MTSEKEVEKEKSPWQVNADCSMCNGSGLISEVVRGGHWLCPKCHKDSELEIRNGKIVMISETQQREEM